jgi:ribosomal protein S18 acetylase RimI-like enzyme
VRIRTAVPGDLERLHLICLRTGDAGEDATTLHGDPDLLGLVWAAPYLHHAPEHAFVVAGADDVARGYVLGALDSRAFEATLEREWWPALRERYPLQAPGRTEADQAAVALIHDPPTAVAAIAEHHPSHLHIDLLPEVQGQGLGRRLLETLLGSLADAGSPGVHLGVAARNERAIGFYRTLGFCELGRSRHGIAFGRSLP